MNIIEEVERYLGQAEETDGYDMLTSQERVQRTNEKHTYDSDKKILSACAILLRQDTGKVLAGAESSVNVLLDNLPERGRYAPMAAALLVSCIWQYSNTKECRAVFGDIYIQNINKKGLNALEAIAKSELFQEDEAWKPQLLACIRSIRPKEVVTMSDWVLKQKCGYGNVVYPICLCTLMTLLCALLVSLLYESFVKTLFDANPNKMDITAKFSPALLLVLYVSQNMKRASRRTARKGGNIVTALSKNVFLSLHAVNDDSAGVELL